MSKFYRGNHKQPGAILWNGVRYTVNDVAHSKGINSRSVTYAMDMWPSLIDEFMRLPYNEFLHRRKSYQPYVKRDVEPVSCYLCWWFGASGSNRFASVIR